MSRKDYILIAEVLADYSANLPEGLVYDFCVTLKKENKTFNPEYFSSYIFEKGESWKILFLVLVFVFVY